MSVHLASVLGLKQKLLPAVNMAVGSSVDPAGATVARSAGIHPKHPNRISDNHCYGLPYQDHNYGAPPPPTPPQSPLPSCTDPAVGVSVFNDVNSDSCDIFSEAPTVTIKCASAPKTNDSSLIPTGLYSKDDAADINVHGDSGDLTRCICGFMHDDGYMICCDQCSVWQHIDCMQIDRNSIPDTYLCEKCNPRPLDREKATRLQRKKHDEFLYCTDIDSILSGSGEESSCDNNNVLYTAIHSTPTSITLSTNRKRNQQLHQQMSKKRKRSADAIKMGKNNDGSKRPRSKSFLADEVEDEYGPQKCLWRMKMKQWSKSYQEAGDRNKYTQIFSSAISGSLAKSEIAEKNITEPESSIVLAQLRAQLAKVQRLRNTLLAMEDIQIGRPIIEYQGSFTLTKQFEVPMSKIYERPYPYILFYSGFDGLDVCVDARTYGNKARYIRRSCAPNSEVRHILDKGSLRLFVYSSKHIKKETEITLPFDFKYENCSYTHPCACARKECPVHRSNRRKLQAKNEIRNNNNHGHKRLAPLRLSLGNLPHQQMNGYISSEDSNTCDTEDNTTDNQRKKSREERKMEAYIRAFEKLEKKERRKVLMQQQSLDKSVSTSDDVKFTTILSPSSNPPSNTFSSSVTSAQTALFQETVMNKVNDSSQDVPFSSATITSAFPQKRIVRRRSGRVRRGSRKYTGEIYQCSSNESHLECEDNLDMFVPFSEDSCDSANQEVAKLLPSDDQPEFRGFTSLPSASVPSVPPLSRLPVTGTMTTFTTFSLGSTDNTLNASGTLTTPITSVIPTTVVLESSDSKCNRMFHSAFSPTIPLEHCNVPTTYNSSEDNSQILSSKTGCFKSPSNSLEQRLPSPAFTGRSRSSSCSSKYGDSRSCSPSIVKSVSMCMNAIYPTVTCNVVPWDFKPGTPSGMVPINVKDSSRCSRYTAVRPIKKWWLERAVNDCLALSSISTEPTEIQEEKENPSASVENAEEEKDPNHISWKKRLVSETSLPNSETDSNDLEADPVAIPIAECETDSMESEDVVNAPTVTDDQVIKDNSSESSSASKVEEKETKDDKEEPVVSEEAETVKEEIKDDPVLVDESSQDASPEEPSEIIATESQVNPTEDTDSNSASQQYAMIQQQVAEEVNYLFDETSCESAVGQYETLADLRSYQSNIYPAPVKRKVSLQEYLKRSKETKKPSTASSTSSSPLSLVSNITVSGGGEIKKKLQPPDTTTTSTPAVLSSITETTKKSKAKVETLSSLGSNLSKALSVLNNNKEVMGLVNKVVKHLKATERVTKDTKPDEPPSAEKKLEKLSSCPTPTSKPVSPQVRKTNSDSKIVAHPPLAARKLESDSSPASSAVHSSNKSFGRKLNMSSSPIIAEPARDKEKIPNSARAIPQNEIRTEQPMDITQTPPLRSPVVLCREDSWTNDSQPQSRSRHGSGASSSSSRSPRHHSETYARYRKSNTHQQPPLTRCGSDNIRPNDVMDSPSLPQKVQCITSAVPGQPIPSLARSCDGRGPQPVYNRASPIRDYRGPSPPPPRWQHSPPYIARNGCDDVGRVPDKYAVSPSPTYVSKFDGRYYEPEHRGGNRDYYRYDEHPPPHTNYPPRQYNGPPVSRRYSNDGYPPRRTPSPQMFHYRQNNAPPPPYYGEGRTSYPDDQRDRGPVYRYHKPPPGNSYNRSDHDSPPPHRRYPSPVPYQSGPNYRSHYTGGYRT